MKTCSTYAAVAAGAGAGVASGLGASVTAGVSSTGAGAGAARSEDVSFAIDLCVGLRTRCLCNRSSGFSGLGNLRSRLGSCSRNRVHGGRLFGLGISYTTKSLVKAFSLYLKFPIPRIPFIVRRS